MALGALLIQRRLKCSDEWLVKHIGENPYLQFFIGMEEYGPCPFGASTPVAFRKRFSEEDMVAILEASVPKEEKKDDPDDKNDPPNSGTLILDATCCPADIAYPRDVDLLNQAREAVEKAVDELCGQTARKKPRMYRRCARRDYLRLSKRWSGIGNAPDVIRSVFWRTRYPGTGRRRRFARSTESACPDPLWASRQRIKSISRQAKKQEYQDNCDRNAAEGVFGTGKTAYGLCRVMARPRETTRCVIGAALLLLKPPGH